MFKDYPEEKEEARVIGRMLGKAAFRALRRISEKIWIPASRSDLEEGLSTAVVKLLRFRKGLRVDKREPPSNALLHLSVEDLEDDEDEGRELYVLKSVGQYVKVEKKRYGTYLYYMLREDGKPKRIPVAILKPVST